MPSKSKKAIANEGAAASPSAAPPATADGDASPPEADIAGGRKRKLEVHGDDEVDAALKQAPSGSPSGSPSASPEAVDSKDGEANGGSEQPEKDDQKSEGQAKEKKDKKEKKEKKAKKDKKDGGDKGDAEAMSDTDYGECDLSVCPAELVIRNAAYAKIEGSYKRLEKASRGRPCYSMHKEGAKKTTYLYWVKEKWQVGFELGHSRSVARVADSKVEGRRMPPCEPHPFAWKVLRVEAAKDENGNEKKSHISTPAMRLLDIAVLGDTPGAFGLSSEPGKTAPPHKKRKVADPKAVGDGKAKATAAADAVGKAAASAAAKGEAFDEDAAAAEAAAAAASSSDEDEDEEEEEKQQEPEESSSDSDSDSDSSSSAGGEKPANPPAAAAAAAAPPKAVAAKNLEFRNKIFEQLRSIKEPRQRQVKLLQIRTHLKERTEKFISAGHFSSVDDLKAFTESLDREFGTPDASMTRAAPKPAAARPGTAKAGSAAPSTPPEKLQSGGAVRKSALKMKKGPQRYVRAPRIHFPSHHINLVKVESFRHMGELLWFQSPGAMVSCDSCNRQVPQSMGALQGEPQKPQFAQCEFLCTDCLQSRNMGQTPHTSGHWQG